MNILNLSDLYNYINNYTTNKNDKKMRGSVFTDTKLINDMLNLLPKNVWTNPDLKWLDPCCGIGNYFIVVYERLMNNLPITDINDRRKHILENMLYFIELDTKYMEILKDIFISDTYKLNIFNGSFFYLHTLDDTIKIYDYDVFNLYFDIIITNPPYQKPNMKHKDKLSAKPLYHLFVINGLKYLKNDGYLSYIHPISWRRKSKEIKIINDILNYKLIYIYTNNKFNNFGISAPYINYYLLQKSNYNINHKTIYDTYFNDKHYYGKIHLNKNLEYIPVLLNNHTINILNKIINKKGEKFDVQLEAKLSTEKKNIAKIKDDTFEYLNLHTYSKKNGRIFRYSNKKHPCHDKLKILMNFKGGYNYLDPFIDNGTMGITDNSMRLYVNEQNKDDLLHFFNSDLLKFLLMITTYNYGANQKNEFHIINTFTIPDKKDYCIFYCINDIERKFIYEFYNLSVFQ